MLPPMLNTNLIDEFNDDQLQNVTERMDLVNAAAQVAERSFLRHKATDCNFYLHSKPRGTSPDIM